MKNILTIIFSLILLISAACRKSERTEIAAIINNQDISISELDSIISPQILKLRMEALDVIISQKMLILEASKRHKSLEELVSGDIFSKCEKITEKDINDYINKMGISFVDKNKIATYLLSAAQKKEQALFVDSLKQFHSILIKLRPQYLKRIDVSMLYSHPLSNNGSSIDVYIVSDFRCPNCQKVEETLKNIYKRYNKRVCFKFIFCSDYIDEMAMACEAAWKQNKFRQMHDSIFKKMRQISGDSLAYSLAREIGLDMTRFKQDINDNTILQKLIDNKDYLISNNIYSTPTFIVNGKILDNRNAIDYLEDVIIEELRFNR